MMSDAGYNYGGTSGIEQKQRVTSGVEKKQEVISAEEEMVVEGEKKVSVQFGLPVTKKIVFRPNNCYTSII